TLREMEPLFLAAIFGCNASLFRDALHEVYIPRIQRGNVSFAANVLGARGPLLSAFSSFLRKRTLGFTGGSGRRGAESHCERSALHPHSLDRAGIRDFRATGAVLNLPYYLGRNLPYYLGR